MWEKYCTAGYAADGNMTHALSTLGNRGYKHTLRIYITYNTSTTTMVARTRLNVTSYVNYLPCYIQRTPEYQADFEE